MQFHVYLITHTESGRVYVGKTKNPRVRWTHHRGGYKSCPSRLRRAILKYGRDAFSFRVLDTFQTEDEAYRSEKLWIQRLRSADRRYGFNLSTGGRGGAAGAPKSPEHRAKIAAAHRGRKRSPEHVAAMRLVPQSPEKGRKISAAKKGKPGTPWSIDRRIALAESNKSRVWTDEARAKIAAARLAMPRSCECGKCLKCKNREKQRRWREARRAAA